MGKLLRWLTLLDADEIEKLETEQAAHPERRPGQRAFAHDLTARVHGRDEADRQARVAEAAFGGGAIDDPAVLVDLFSELGGFVVGAEAVRGGAAGVAGASGLFSSQSEVRRSISQGGLTINSRRVSAPDETVTPIGDRWFVVRSGKRRLAVGRLEG